MPADSDVLPPADGSAPLSEDETLAVNIELPDTSTTGPHQTNTTGPHQTNTTGPHQGS